MPISSSKRAYVALAVLIGIAAAGAGLYIYRLNRPLPAATGGKARSGFSEHGPATDRTPNLLSGLLDGLPADAPIVVYVDVAALRKLHGSPLAAVLGLANGAPQSDADYREFVRGTGFDYTRDLDQVAIAFWPAGLGGAPPENVLGDQKLFAIADGRFDEPKIKAYVLRTGEAVKRGTETLYEAPGSPPVSLKFLSPGRIAIASGKGSKSLLTVSNSMARDPAVQAGIERIGKAPIFGVARTDLLPSNFYAVLKNSPQLVRLVRSVQDLTLAGQPEGDLLKMALDAEANSVKNALEIAALLEISRMGASMALADPRTTRQMTQAQAAFLATVVKEAKISRQGRSVRLSLDITPEMLSSAPTLSTGAPASRGTR